LYPEVYVQYGTNIELLSTIYFLKFANFLAVFSKYYSSIYSSFLKPVVIVLIFENPGSAQICEIQNFRKYQFLVIV